MTKQEYADKKNKVLVVGTGRQAPYGIGEIIKCYGTSERSITMARNFAARWYNRPAIILPISIVGANNY